MVINQKDIAGYRWENSDLTCAHDYLLPTVFAEMERLKAKLIGGGGGSCSCLNLAAATEVLPTRWPIRAGR